MAKKKPDIAPTISLVATLQLYYVSCLNPAQTETTSAKYESPNTGLQQMTTIVNYRKDIDGLRALSVVAVLLFHAGTLTNGFLGVDVFFLISGYLLTGILYRDTLSGKPDLRSFYLRRLRRIVPLCLTVSALSLLAGYLLMLPDDLRNLAQSVIATELFSNNILLARQSRDYWNIANEYKPLMHTWSLAVEEQFYLILPLIFVFISRTKKDIALAAVSVLMTASFVASLYTATSSPTAFFYLPFRFWEIAAGGVVAILETRGKLAPLAAWAHNLSLIILIGLLALPDIELNMNLLQLSIATCCFLLLFPPPPKKQNAAFAFLTNSISQFLGKISYSIYMWHQPIFAFTRYSIEPEISSANTVALFAITISISFLSYIAIEQPFRRTKFITDKALILILLSMSGLLAIPSLAILWNHGIVRNVPELEIDTASKTVNVHWKYNERINDLNQSFRNNNGIKVLVVGDSYGRDWCNILLESQYSAEMDLTYARSSELGVNFNGRLREADIVFCAFSGTFTQEQALKEGIPLEKTWVVGTKNFGWNNGVFYNHRGPGYSLQRTSVRDTFLETNCVMKQLWGNRYVDLLELLIDADGKVPVFTPQGKFISQDTTHLTKAGASFFARLLEDRFAAFF